MKIQTGSQYLYHCHIFIFIDFFFGNSFLQDSCNKSFLSFYQKSKWQLYHIMGLQLYSPKMGCANMTFIRCLPILLTFPLARLLAFLVIQRPVALLCGLAGHGPRILLLDHLRQDFSLELTDLDFWYVIHTFFQTEGLCLILIVILLSFTFT